MNAMRVFGRNQPAIQCMEVAAVASISNYIDRPTEIGARTGRGGNAHIGPHAEDDNSVGPQTSQTQVEVCADEGGVHRFGDQLHRRPHVDSTESEADPRYVRILDRCQIETEIDNGA